LERIYQHKLSVDRFGRSGWSDDFVRALRAHDMEQVPGPRPDCRWGCIFYDARNTRVLTMYFDGPGGWGLIHGVLVEVRGGPSAKLALVALLEKRYLLKWE
jgi:hypothetical protein